MKQIAVFTRNHASYLIAACHVTQQDSNRPITFRSAKRWSTAEAALRKQKTLQLYFAPIGSTSTVQYEATLKFLVLDPKEGDAGTESWLPFALPDTLGEGLWQTENTGVKTLYVVSHCQRLERPFPITELRKASDGVPISKDYGYSYVPVLQLEGYPSHYLSPAEIAVSEIYFDGATSSARVNAYERNPEARTACISHYGLDCVVCSINFRAAYGAIGEGFIHVHHLKPLASIKAAHQIDPIADLRPVCPNCHAMLHMKTPPYTIDELISAHNQN